MRTVLAFLSFFVVTVLFTGSAMAEITIGEPHVYSAPGLFTIALSQNQYFDMGGFFIPTYNFYPTSNPNNTTFKIENDTNVVATSNKILGYISTGNGAVYSSSLIFNITNFSAKTRNDYNLTVTLNDDLGNISKKTIRKVRFIENPEALEHITITNNATNMSSVDVVGSVNASFDFKFLNYTNGTMDIARYNSSPESASIAGSALGKYIEVMLEPNLTANLRWAIVRVHYTDFELANKSIQNEASLRFYEYDESSQSWVVVPGSGVDVDNNFVYMNVTHFSTYGVYEEPAAAASTSSSGGGGGGKKTVNQTTDGPASYGSESEYDLKKRIVRDLYDRWISAYPDRSWGAGVDDAMFDLWFRHMEYNTVAAES